MIVRGLAIVLGAWLLAAAPAPAQVAGEDAVALIRQGDYMGARGVWQRAAEQGDEAAMYNLATLLNDPAAGFNDRARAIYWYEQAIAAGHVPARYNLALLLIDPRKPDYDPQRAIALWREAAEAGVADAAYNLGIVYLEGNLVERDLATAERYLQQAVTQGFTPAKEPLAEVREQLEADARESGESFVVINPRLKLAKGTTRASTRQDDRGRVLLTDQVRSRKALNPASEDSESERERLRQQAQALYAEGQRDEARRRWQDLAAGGDAVSAERLGSDLLQDPEQHREALVWLSRAADAGRAGAQYSLAELYLSGQRQFRNPARGWLWMTLAAQGGDERAKARLAVGR